MQWAIIVRMESPNVIGGVLQRQEGIRVFWDESEGSKIVVVDVEGEGLKEGENLIQ